MPDIFYLISRWWKQMLMLVVLALVVVATIVFLQPSRYLSVTTALPASSVLADKAAIFNNNVEGLYSSIGTPDDLDRILGTARLDTVYLAVASAYNLWDHYKITGPETLQESAETLKKNSRVMRSEYGELKVKVWDTDRNLAPQLANELVARLNAIHQALQNENNKRIVTSLHEGKRRLQAAVDSITNGNNASTAASSQTSIMLGQLQQYDELIGEYQLTIDTNPSVLMVVEKARASSIPDKPRRLMILTATAVLSLLFALLMALVLERRKRIVL